MFAGRSWEEWIVQYGTSHRHPLNRFCHTVGIPLIALSLPLFLAIPFMHGIWPIPTAMFVSGWVLQFVGHPRRDVVSRHAVASVPFPFACFGSMLTTLVVSILSWTTGWKRRTS